MINNELEYRITKEEADHFTEALAQVEQYDSSEDPIIRKAMHDSLTSILEELREDLATYDTRRSVGSLVHESEAAEPSVGISSIPHALRDFPLLRVMYLVQRIESLERILGEQTATLRQVQVELRALREKSAAA